MDNMIKAYEQEVINKAIDEFAERMFRICDDRGTKICAISNAPLYAHEDGTWHSLIRDVAEQMKGGAT